MKRVFILGIFLFSFTRMVLAADADKENGRYTLYFLQNDQKQTPLLLDTKTGKIWQYTEEQGLNPSIGANLKSRFKGVTVEGLVFSPKDLGELEKQIETMHVNGFVNKDLKGFSETMVSEFAYSLDIEKAQGIYERLRARQPEKNK